MKPTYVYRITIKPSHASDDPPWHWVVEAAVRPGHFEVVASGHHQDPYYASKSASEAVARNETKD